MPRPTIAGLAVSILRGVIAGLILLVGVFVIYAFGAGYFGYFAAPTPLNFVVAALLLLTLIRALWKWL